MSCIANHACTVLCQDRRLSLFSMIATLHDRSSRSFQCLLEPRTLCSRRSPNPAGAVMIQSKEVSSFFSFAFLYENSVENILVFSKKNRKKLRISQSVSRRRPRRTRRPRKPRRPRQLYFNFQIRSLYRSSFSRDSTVVSLPIWMNSMSMILAQSRSISASTS